MIIVSFLFSNVFSARAQSYISETINMDQDEFEFEGEKYDISSFGTISDEKAWEMQIEEGGLNSYININRDDIITTLIPKEKFLSTTNELVAGKEWGYYINTQIAFPYGDDTLVENRISYVTIFDLEYSFNETNFLINVSVNPVCQFEYAVLSANENVMVIPQGDGFEQVDYTGHIKYRLSKGSETFDYTIDCSKNTVNTKYSEDLIIPLGKFTQKLGYVEVKIYKVDILVNDQVTVTFNIEQNNYLPENASYSISIDSAFGGGVGTEKNAYLITTERHFKNMRYNKDNNIYFEIAASFTVTGSPITDFYGHFINKQSPGSVTYKITKKSDDSSDKYEGLGLFVNNYGTIDNIFVISEIKFTYVIDREFYVGGVAARNYGTISNCGVSFTGTNECTIGYLGGIAGLNEGTIIGCNTSGLLTGYGNIGGVAGINKGRIADCFFAGTINQYIGKVRNQYFNTSAGGIVGINDTGATVENCDVATEADSRLLLNIFVDKVDNKTIAPYTGPICGQNKGTIRNCNFDKNSYFLDTGNLHSFGILWNKFDQKKNINEITNS